MKMPAMNFDFGPFTESGVVALSPYGIAVRSSKGEYLTYNAVTGATIDGEKFINEIPCNSEGRELATLNQNASKANDNW